MSTNVQQRLDAIKVGDSLVVKLGFEDDPPPNEGKVVARLEDDYFLVDFPGVGMIVTNTWFVDDPPHNLHHAPCLNPIASEDVGADDLLTMLRLHHGRPVNDEFQGGLFEIVSINGIKLEKD